MSWSEKLMASLDERATVVATARGDVQLAREGKGPPVVVAHGGPGGFDQGLAYGRHLTDGGCELLAPSRPGYLRTPLPSGRSPQHQADLYAAMLDALRIEKATIFGFSSGGPSAVHFAARYPDRTTALLLDSAILLPFEPRISAVERAVYESRLLVWLSYQMARRQPRLVTAFLVAGTSQGLTRKQRTAATDWITSDPARLRSVQEEWVSIAPRRHRAAGWANDKANEATLPPLPFAAVTAPTLLAHGTSDRVVPVGHAATAANEIPRAELVLVEEGHHLLSVSRNYGPVAQRQLELARR